MKRESNLLLLFGKSAHKNIPLTWKELREKLPDQSALEVFFRGYGDEPYRYQPEHWHLFLPKSRQWVISAIEPATVCKWVWFFPEDEGGGISDRRLRQILAKAVKWAIEHGVANVTITFPSSTPGSRKPWQRRSAKHRRMAWLMRFMSATEAQTGLVLGVVMKERRRGHYGE